MVFNSSLFFFTLALFLIFYFSSAHKRSTRVKVVTLLYSYFFYGMWNVAFLVLILLSTVIDYAAARGIEWYPQRKKPFLIVSVVINLSLLGFFKYYNFIAMNLAAMSEIIGLRIEPVLLDIPLPVGISFYTFQTLSYTISVYKNELPAKHSLLDVAVFVAFFPQLVAGPILRATNFFPQLEEEPENQLERFLEGVFLILFGLFYKCVIADNVGAMVERLFSQWQSNGLLENWAAATLFGIQIFGDFQGYSLIALGIGCILGFNFPKNFNAPYAAVGFSDFWRRWHISLSTWFRDYLYIPLGGNRRGMSQTYRNIMVTMMLVGIWHGSSWTFLVWGALHGFFLCCERALQQHNIVSTIIRTIPRSYASFIGTSITYIVVSATWIPFRAGSIEQCVGMMKGLFSQRLYFSQYSIKAFVIVTIMVLAQHIARRIDFFGITMKEPFLRFLVTVGIIISLFYFSGERAEFIYFQF
jgi:alginate O-acetyltransferase complex protein AlgI